MSEIHEGDRPGRARRSGRAASTRGHRRGAHEPRGPPGEASGKEAHEGSRARAIPHAGQRSHERGPTRPASPTASARDSHEHGSPCQRQPRASKAPPRAHEPPARSARARSDARPKCAARLHSTQIRSRRSTASAASVPTSPEQHQAASTRGKIRSRSYFSRSTAPTPRARARPHEARQRADCAQHAHEASHERQRQHRPPRASGAAIIHPIRAGGHHRRARPAPRGPRDRRARHV